MTDKEEFNELKASVNDAARQEKVQRSSWVAINATAGSLPSAIADQNRISGLTPKLWGAAVPLLATEELAISVDVPDPGEKVTTSGQLVGGHVDAED